MKKILLISVLLFVFCFAFLKSNVLAQGTISQSDKLQITESLDLLVESLNNGDYQTVTDLISPGNKTLQLDIQQQMPGLTSYQLDYLPFDKNTEILGVDKVKVKAKFKASGMGWNVEGLSTYFVFEKELDNWYITETDFHTKLGSDYVLNIFKKLSMILVPIVLLCLAFWTWMLIDCIKRDFDDKTLWIILMIFVGFISSILYFFLVKKKNVTRKPLEYNILESETYFKDNQSEVMKEKHMNGSRKSKNINLLAILIKALILFVLAFLIVFILLILLKNNYNPITRFQCMKNGKEYRLGGCSIRTYICTDKVITYSDGGKLCTDSSQCQGVCVGSYNSETKTGLCTNKSDEPGCGCFSILDSNIPSDLQSMCVD